MEKRADINPNYTPPVEQTKEASAQSKTFEEKVEDLDNDFPKRMMDEMKERTGKTLVPCFVKRVDNE